MEGVVALLIPIVAVGGFFAWMIALSPVGKAFAERFGAAPGPRWGVLETKRCSRSWSSCAVRWRNWRSA